MTFIACKRDLTLIGYPSTSSLRNCLIFYRNDNMFLRQVKRALHGFHNSYMLNKEVLPEIFRPGSAKD